MPPYERVYYYPYCKSNNCYSAYTSNKVVNRCDVCVHYVYEFRLSQRSIHYFLPNSKSLIMRIAMINVTTGTIKYARCVAVAQNACVITSVIVYNTYVGQPVAPFLDPCFTCANTLNHLAYKVNAECEHHDSTYQCSKRSKCAPKVQQV